MPQTFQYIDIYDNDFSILTCHTNGPAFIMVFEANMLCTMVYLEDRVNLLRYLSKGLFFKQSTSVVIRQAPSYSLKKHGSTAEALTYSLMKKHWSTAKCLK